MTDFAYRDYLVAWNFCGCLFLPIGHFLSFAGIYFCDLDRVVFLAGNYVLLFSRSLVQMHWQDFRCYWGRAIKKQILKQIAGILVILLQLHRVPLGWVIAPAMIKQWLRYRLWTLLLIFVEIFWAELCWGLWIKPQKKKFKVDNKWSKALCNPFLQPGQSVLLITVDYCSFKTVNCQQ